MHIVKRFKETGSEWKPIPLEECLEHTEGRGYWRLGSVVTLLLNGETVWTPFAEYKLLEGSPDG